MSDSFSTEASVVRERLADSWTATEIDWVFFNDRVKDWGDGTAHIRPAILVSNADRVTLGPNARRRVYGSVVISVFVPVGAGDNLARQYAEDVGDLFRDYQSSGLTFEEPYERVVGPDPEGRNYYQVNVWIPFRRDLIA